MSTQVEANSTHEVNGHVPIDSTQKANPTQENETPIFNPITSIYVFLVKQFINILVAYCGILIDLQCANCVYHFIRFEFMW
jgi:hypothetical protein